MGPLSLPAAAWEPCEAGWTRKRQMGGGKKRYINAYTANKNWQRKEAKTGEIMKLPVAASNNSSNILC